MEIFKQIDNYITSGAKTPYSIELMKATLLAYPGIVKYLQQAMINTQNLSDDQNIRKGVIVEFLQGVVNEQTEIPSVGDETTNTVNSLASVLGGAGDDVKVRNMITLLQNISVIQRSDDDHEMLSKQFLENIMNNGTLGVSNTTKKWSMTFLNWLILPQIYSQIKTLSQNNLLTYEAYGKEPLIKHMIDEFVSFVTKILILNPS